jgi:hypothetical protein
MRTRAPLEASRYWLCLACLISLMMLLLEPKHVALYKKSLVVTAAYYSPRVPRETPANSAELTRVLFLSTTCPRCITIPVTIHSVPSLVRSCSCQVSRLNQNSNALRSFEQNFPILNFMEILSAILELGAFLQICATNKLKYLPSGQL